MSKIKNIFFGRHLWITNTISGGVLLALGDLIQQSIEQRNSACDGNAKQYDLERSGRMTTVGFALGLPHHYWYLFLDRLIPGTSMRCVAKKILLDQSCFSPFANFVFFTGSGLLEGNSYKDSWNEFKEKFPMVYKTDCLFWPPAQIVNFTFLSPTYRVLYVNFFTLAWNVFLSYAKNFDKVNIHVGKEMPLV